MENKIQKYVIVGNGFDLNLGIRSSYGDFVENIKKEYQLENSREVYEFNNLFIQNYDGNCLSWSDFETVFENQVLEINSQRFLKEDESRKRYLIDKLNAELRKLEFEFYNYLNLEYTNWLNNHINRRKQLNPIYRSIFSGAKIVSFNFTDSVRDIMNGLNLDSNGLSFEKHLYQVHGSLKENNILFGGGFSGTDKVENIFIPGSMDNDKLIRIKNNRTLTETRRVFREGLTKEDKIELYILGHSIDGSDLAFMEELFKKASKIYIFYFRDDYLPKLESISKKISKEVAEKVFLLPFFEVLLPGEDELVCLESTGEKDSLNLDYIQKFFNFSVPVEEEFQKITVSKNNFIFKNIGSLQIESIREAETLLKFLESINPNQLTIKDNSYLSISGVEFTKSQALNGGEVIESVFNKLLENSVFQKILRNVYSLKISDSEFGLQKLTDGLRGNNLKQFELSRNTIYFESGQELDLSDFSNSNFMHLKENIFQNISDDQQVISLLAKNTNASRVKNIYLADNENVEYQASIYEFSAMAKIVHLPYPMYVDEEYGMKTITFSKVEQMTLVGEEDAAELDHILLNADIESVTLDNVLFTHAEEQESGSIKRKPNLLSKLFEKKEVRYLREIKFIDCGVSVADYSSDFIDIMTDFFTKKVTISFGGKDNFYDLKQLLFSNTKAMSGKLAVNDTKAELNRSKEIQEVIHITGDVKRRLSEFAKKWYVNEEDLLHYIQAIGHPATILAPAKKQVFSTTAFSKYIDTNNQPMKLMKAKKQFKAELQKFIEELPRKEGTNGQK